MTPDPTTARQNALAISTEEFRKLAHELVDRITGHLATLPQRPVTRGESPAEIRALLDSERQLPAGGDDAAALLSEAADLLFDHSLFNGHPRFWGYVTSSPAPIGILGDFLAAAVNANVGSHILAPIATEMEAQTVRWIAEFIGYPRDCSGLLVSGGNMANFVGFLAARAARLGPQVRERGMAAAPACLRVYASSATHTWIQKAADLFGLGTSSIRWIPVDRGQRMEIAALRAQVETDRAQGDQPFLVVGTAGSVGTGAVDPLPEIAALCRKHGLWFHVDGAYGGLAARVPGVTPDLAALKEADSVAVDPHKWLYSPLEAGCALVRDPSFLRGAFSYHPEYYHFDKEAINYFDMGPQNSRGFRALKVWLALRQAGSEGYLRVIADDIRLAERFHSLLAEYDELEPVTLGLSISTFRYVPRELRGQTADESVAAQLDALNQDILTRIEKSGEAFVSNAVVDGRFVLRMCIVNFQTTETDVEALPAIVLRHAREARCR
jgi:glutamate/tyrosine decarboxylase-like PLP-dependent enzyme